MSESYVGEIRMFGGNFAPAGWLFCDGQLLPIAEYDALFNLIGTTYGGDGQQTFGLPDLRGRVPIHQNSGFTLGEMGGVESVTVTSSQMTGHTHQLTATTSIGNESGPAGNVLAQSSVASAYVGDVADTSLASSAITTTGGSQPHENMGPFLAVHFIISPFGIFPSQ